MKKKYYTLALSLLFVLPLAACGRGGEDKDNEPDGGEEPITGVSTLDFTESMQTDYVNWYGRNLHEMSFGAVVCNNSAAGFEVAFYGTQLSVEYVSEPVNGGVAQGSMYVCIDVDGAGDFTQTKKLAKHSSQTEVVLVKDLEEGEHTVAVYKAVEDLCATWEIYSLACDGYFTAPPERSGLKIEMYGDSLTAGLSVMREAGTSDSVDSEQENAMLSYGACAARELNAQYSAFCVSGACAGLYASNTGAYVIPNLFERYAPNAGAKNVWDFSAYVPDIVLVDLGTNDIISCGSEENFTQKLAEKYTAFLSALRRVYPDAYMVVCCGTFPTFHEVDVCAYNGLFAEIASGMNDPKISCFTFDAPAQRGHPSMSETAAYGKELAAYLKTLGA